MTCPICKTGHTSRGTSTITLERGSTTIVFKEVPANVCQTCGEVYVDSDVTERLLREAEGAAAAGVQVEVRAYAA
ncbi:MAG: type II toxin-antitoxin system MqsA family antitoxin [Fimbriimonas ginsengisoli]|uniref:Type II toxin-antitoxin system MqsA family antitoxin n=1 Tax=Fimbriimonas ginsengisoli TaxID=1005039 RepID=A0A931LRG1_FIMGI|nr:type II toxin-antitoxin system MqsA family antitoxin [Fimbriimonas ginsengisoli]